MLKFITALLFAQVLLAAPLPQFGGTIEFPSIGSPLPGEKPLTQEEIANFGVCTMSNACVDGNKPPSGPFTPNPKLPTDVTVDQFPF